MNTRFCSFCGNSNPFEAIKPTFCGKCGKSFAAAFAIVAPSVSASQPLVSAPINQRPSPSQRPSPRTLRGARGHNVVNQLDQVDQPDSQDEFANEDETFVSRDEISAAAQALASTISSDDFVCGADDEGTHHGRLTPPQGHAIVSQAKSIRKRRKTS